MVKGAGLKILSLSEFVSSNLTPCTVKDKIILATTSWVRIKEFKKSGIYFEQMGSNVDESVVERKDPRLLVSKLSKMKCEAVAKKYHEGIVMGFDSVGYFENEFLEKPITKKESFNRIKRMFDKEAKFITGIHMINTKTGKQTSEVIETCFLLKKLTDKQITDYLGQEEKFNTLALGFNPTKYPFKDVLKITKGNPDNLLGLPMKDIKEMIQKIKSN